MKNPLRKRLLRELKGELSKYCVILILLIGTIGFTSGFLVADDSMLAAYNEGFEKYNIEDGHFLLAEKANKAQVKAIQELGVTLYEQFYAEEFLTNGSTLRIYADRAEVNTICLMEGELPTAADEIAIDRMYADNNDIQVGDTLESDARQWTVTGFVALPDYSCLFSDNNDTMFDAIKFGVGIVSAEGFADFDEELLTYDYAWKYNDGKPAAEKDEKEKGEDLMKGIFNEAELEEFIPCYANQAIWFTGDDMGSDRAMMVIMLYMVIAIMAFVFGITTSNTITREACVIGTLRASGYTRGELMRHYMTLPVVMTAIGALIGNVLGYTWFKGVCAGMYYGSYSLPTYVTRWNATAFWQTTVIPILLMLIVNYMILHRKLSLQPLKFLRRDLRRRRQKRALPLSPRLRFFARFRLRVILQNMSNYIVLFFGILFANMLLIFGLGLPVLLDHYAANLADNLLSNYQYILSVPIDAMNENRKLESLIAMMSFMNEVETENEDAEKFSVYSLNTVEHSIYKSEELMLYGIQEDSRYVHISFAGDGVYVSSAYADKYELVPGDTIELKEEYEEDTYTFTVEGIYPYEGSLVVFMPQDMLNTTFDLGDDYFCGYFSDTEITDIDEKYIGSVIDLESLTKISRQLDVSMGGMMGMVNGFALIMFMVVVYLLSKIIIEKNAQSISMTKILGYTTGEIGRLYVISTAIMVMLSILVSMPLLTEALVGIFRIMMIMSFNGWLTIYLDPSIYVEMFLMGMGTYVLVSLLEFRRIKRVPMDEALKNVE